MIRRIAINSGGGDAPGLNAVIRSVALGALNRNWQVVGIKCGYQGLLDKDPELLVPINREAVKGIPNYKSDYDYDMAVHLRLRRIPIIGQYLRRVLDRFLPGWEESVFWTLLTERESFAALILASVAPVFFFVLRILLRWYSEKRLGIHQVHMREQLLRAARVFMGGTS